MLQFCKWNKHNSSMGRWNRGSGHRRNLAKVTYIGLERSTSDLTFMLKLFTPASNASQCFWFCFEGFFCCFVFWFWCLFFLFHCLYFVWFCYCFVLFFLIKILLPVLKRPCHCQINSICNSSLLLVALFTCSILLWSIVLCLLVNHLTVARLGC